MADEVRFLGWPRLLLLWLSVVHILRLDVLLPLDLTQRARSEEVALELGHLRRLCFTWVHWLVGMR